jgi:hypothetical protein
MSVYPNLIPPLFFLTFLAIGLWITPDYGVSWDEDIQRKHGRVVWDYIHQQLDLTQDQPLEPDITFREYEYRFHGTLFQLSCLWVQQQLNLTDYRDITLLRHYGVFLLFFIGTLFFYRTLEFRFQRWQIALLGTAMLILSPRIFGNAFFNIKDLVILPYYIIASYTLLRFLAQKNWQWAVWHGVACALVINARLMGVWIPCITLGFYLFDLLRHDRVLIGRKLIHFGLFVLTTISITILLWPYLWEQPFQNFIDAFALLSKYNWGGEMRYFGSWINAQELPWHYALGWIHISTPLVYLLLFWTGTFQILRNFFQQLFKGFYKNKNQLYDLVFLALALGPLLIVIVKESVLYDSWRHLFFIYPAMIAVAVRAFIRLNEWLKERSTAKIIQRLPSLFLSLAMGVTFVYLLTHHPYQHTYITLPSDHIEKRFDIDYWGVAYQTALRELIEKDGRNRIKVRSANYPNDANARLLPKDIRDRIELVWDIQKADYYVTNYRSPTELKRYQKNLFPLLSEKEFLSIQAWNGRIIGVYSVDSSLSE